MYVLGNSVTPVTSRLKELKTSLALNSAPSGYLFGQGHI